MLKDNQAKSRFELAMDGEVVFCTYRKEGDVVYLLHVEAPPSLRGTGAAGKFMQALMEYLRDKGLKASPVCSYAVTWLECHKKYSDSVA